VSETGDNSIYFCRRFVSIICDGIIYHCDIETAATRRLHTYTHPLRPYHVGLIPRSEVMQSLAIVLH